MPRVPRTVTGTFDYEPTHHCARDVAQIACATDLDFDRVLAIARRWRGRAVVQRALQTTAARLPVSDRRSYAAQMATGVWALDGIRPRVEYVVALLFPDREYLRRAIGAMCGAGAARSASRDSNRAR